VEADFRREYGMRLIDELPRMSLREFMNLAKHLSSHSVYVMSVAPLIEPKQQQVVTDPEQMERIFEDWGK
jgi:hypothetical protein